MSRFKFQGSNVTIDLKVGCDAGNLNDVILLPNKI